MTIRRSADGTIELDGICPIEDAETLQRYLLAAPGAAVDWRSCRQAHTAVIQVLMASAAVLHGPPAGATLALLLGSLEQSQR
ncbi:MAG TPA: hypothetical protein VEW72_02690 [Burkholderiales bacterium]|nr:hypothetical protein [Burkholderiales bacterium]